MSCCVAHAIVDPNLIIINIVVVIIRRSLHTRPHAVFVPAKILRADDVDDDDAAAARGRRRMESSQPRRGEASLRNGTFQSKSFVATSAPARQQSRAAEPRSQKQQQAAKEDSNPQQHPPRPASQPASAARTRSRRPGRREPPRARKKATRLDAFVHEDAEADAGRPAAWLARGCLGCLACFVRPAWPACLAADFCSKLILAATSSRLRRPGQPRPEPS